LVAAGMMGGAMAHLFFFFCFFFFFFFFFYDGSRSRSLQTDFTEDLKKIHGAGPGDCTARRPESSPTPTPATLSAKARA
jgi:hypothetical protein